MRSTCLACSLHHWCKLEASQGEQAFPGSGHQSAQEEELRRLKRELETVRQERDILIRSAQVIRMRATVSGHFSYVVVNYHPPASTVIFKLTPLMFVLVMLYMPYCSKVTSRVAPGFS